MATRPSTTSSTTPRSPRSPRCSATCPSARTPAPTSGAPLVGARRRPRGGTQDRRGRAGAAREGHPVVRQRSSSATRSTSTNARSGRPRTPAEPHVTIPASRARCSAPSPWRVGGRTTETVDVTIKGPPALVGGRIRGPDRGPAAQGAGRRERRRTRLPVAVGPTLLLRGARRSPTSGSPWRPYPPARPGDGGS